MGWSAARLASERGNRFGDSNATTGRPPASSSRAPLRAASRARHVAEEGYRSPTSPLATSAVSTADGPGTTVTSRPLDRARPVDQAGPADRSRPGDRRRSQGRLRRPARAGAGSPPSAGPSHSARSSSASSGCRDDRAAAGFCGCPHRARHRPRGARAGPGASRPRDSRSAWRRRRVARSGRTLRRVPDAPKRAVGALRPGRGYHSPSQCPATTSHTASIGAGVPGGR